MEKIPVLLVRSRKDAIFEALVERLGVSQRFSLYQARTWNDEELARLLAERKPIGCALVVLVCSSERNEELSAALLAGHPRLVVVRIDVGAASREIADTINVDLVQHLRLDQRRLGFDRLLSAMQYLVEHHGTGDAERLARFLVLDDSRSQDGGVRFLRVPPRRSAGARDGKLPPAAMRWLNALLRDYFARYQPVDDGGLSMSRARALSLLDSLESGPRGPGDELRAAEQALLEQLARTDAAPHALFLLQQQLSLSHDALLSLIICLAPEVDLGYQLVFGHIQDDMMRRHASGALIDALRFGHGASTAAPAVASLVGWRLLVADGMHAPAAEQCLRVDPAIIEWLFVGDRALLADPPVKAAILEDAWSGGHFLCEAADKEAREHLTATLARRAGGSEWAVLTGADSDGWRALLELAAADATTGLLRVPLARVAALEPAARQDTALRLTRAAMLMNWHVAVDCADAAIDEPALSALVDTHAARRRPGVLIAVDARAAAASVLPRGSWRTWQRGTPSLKSRARHFDIVLSSLGITLETREVKKTLSERLASAYPLSVAGLTTAATLASAELLPGMAAEQRLQVLGSACRRVAAPDILRLARRIEPTCDLDDVIVPPDRKALLEEILANARHGRVVLDDWGFGNQLPYGRGVAVLFAGPSGTGKTLAAQAIAHELNVDLFAVDLSRIVSKYIGETEKHLDSVIGDAERSGAVLLFDEADALFGKRSEVKDAHDRYANIEVAYLLQRMESFSGLAILTTNSRQNLDPAFLRRLRFIVDFPRPDAALRERIWRQCMPGEAPVSEHIDWRLLAHFDLSGGVIRQVTLRAAFLAARSKPPVQIGMPHLLAALRSEFNKLGMQAAEREIAEYQQAAALVAGKAA